MQQQVAPTRLDPDPSATRPAVQLRHLVGGRLLPGDPGGDAAAAPVVDPSSGAVIASRPGAGPDLVAEASVVAAEALREWAAMPAQERAAAVKRFGAALRDRAAELAQLTTAEMGKPIGDAEGGVEAGLSAVDTYAELGPLHRGRALAGDPAALDLMVHEPHGVVAVITPWNDPVAVALQNLSAALVVGNAVLWKPSERAPLTADLVAECAAETLPAGVLAVLQGAAPTGEAILERPEVAMLLFVGGTASGRRVARLCAERMIPTVLELGGNDAMIIDETVDVQWAAEQAAMGCFANAGQICSGTERLLVHRDVHDELCEALVAEAAAWRPGDPRDRSTRMGPLVDERHRAGVHAAVSSAVEAGAIVLAGGAIPEGPGSFYPPTVLCGVPRDTALLQEETFGPVAAVCPVEDFDDALDLMDGDGLGLSASVMTSDRSRALRAARRLQVGTVKIGAAFGGAPGGAADPRRGSGHGRGYGPELLDELTVVKVIHDAGSRVPPR